MLKRVIRRPSSQWWRKECKVDGETGICTTCARFLALGIQVPLSWRATEAVLGPEFKHHDRAESQQCQEGGCLLCSYLWEYRIAQVPEEDAKQGLKPVYTRLALYKQSVSGISVLYLLTEQQGFHQDWILNTAAIKKPFQGEWSFRLQPKQTTTSWLQKCSKDHEVCEFHKPVGRWIPRRLIDLQKVADTGQVRLCHRSEIEGFVQYATLSHRWGDRTSDSSDCLNAVTESQLRTGRPTASFCNLFREAMEFTSRLGLRYLWIDSLCIMQGRGSEWQSESSRMSNVYGHSMVTLAASACVNGDDHLSCSGFRDLPFELRADTSTPGNSV